RPSRIGAAADPEPRDQMSHLNDTAFARRRYTRKRGGEAIFRAASARALSGSATERFSSIHDARREEDHELVARVRRSPALEQDAEDRDVTEEGHLVEVSTGVTRVDSTDDRGVTVHHEEVGLRFALEDRRIAARRGLLE